MFGSRRNRPSLIARAAGTAARTAVVVGTANVVSAKMSAGRAPAAAPVTPLAAAAGLEPTAISPAAPAALTSEAIAQLQQLAELRTAGILTDEEFAAQKARLLA